MLDPVQPLEYETGLLVGGESFRRCLKPAPYLRTGDLKMAKDSPLLVIKPLKFF